MFIGAKLMITKERVEECIKDIQNADVVSWLGKMNVEISCAATHRIITLLRELKETL